MSKSLLPLLGLAVLSLLPAYGESDSCPDPVLPWGDKDHYRAFPWGDADYADGYEYVKANVIYDVPALEFLMAYHGIAECDPDEAIKTLNDPIYWNPKGDLPPPYEMFTFSLRYDYVVANVEDPVLEREYSIVYGNIAVGDPYEAIRIFNDPDYPDAYMEYFGDKRKRNEPVLPPTPFAVQAQIPILILAFAIISLTAFMIMHRILR